MLGVPKGACSCALLDAMAHDGERVGPEPRSQEEESKGLAFLDQPGFLAETLDELQQPADGTGWVQKHHALTARLPGLDDAADATAVHEREVSQIKDQRTTGGGEDRDRLLEGRNSCEVELPLQDDVP